VSPRSAYRRLTDVVEAIDLIEEYASHAAELRREAAAMQERSVPLAAVADAVLYRFVVLGEAASALDARLTARMPEIPWADLVGIRNVVTHPEDELDRPPRRRDDA
jgi:uncharacterized protein with HEPN domain